MFVKNNDSQTHIWNGQTITAGSYYELEQSEISRWRNNTDFLTDLANSVALMAKDDSGNNDITDYASGLAYLNQEKDLTIIGIPSGSFETKIYKLVSSYGSDSLDYTPANQEKIVIYEIGGSAAVSTDVKVEVIWDADGTPDVLFATHGAVTKSCRIELVGNATKKLRIKLTNDSSQSETIGAYWIGRIE